MPPPRSQRSYCCWGFCRSYDSISDASETSRNIFCWSWSRIPAKETWTRSWVLDWQECFSRTMKNVHRGDTYHRYHLNLRTPLTFSWGERESWIYPWPLYLWSHYCWDVLWESRKRSVMKHSVMHLSLMQIIRFDDLQFCCGHWDVLRDVLQVQVWTVHHIRLASAFGWADRIIATVIIEPTVLSPCNTTSPVTWMLLAAKFIQSDLKGILPI